jgi:hypothetical protein
MIEWSILTIGNCRRLADVPKGAQILAVNGRYCIGRCEACSRPILEGQKYYYDSEGVTWHERCPSSANSPEALCVSCKKANVSCPIHPQDTQHCVEYVPSRSKAEWMKIRAAKDENGISIDMLDHAVGIFAEGFGTEETDFRPLLYCVIRDALASYSVISSTKEGE